MSILNRHIVFIMMKNKQQIENRFKFLIEKFHAGNCIPPEMKELQTFFNEEALSSEIKNKMFHELEQKAIHESVVFDGKKMFEKLKYQIEGNNHKHKFFVIPRMYRIVSHAAIFVLFFVLSGLAIYIINQKISVEKQILSYSKIVVPVGAKSQVILPDSSVVWLNAGSKLTYSSDFNINNRLVHLEGEGYFKVTKNNKNPFIVDAFGFLVEGSETEFNIKAYNNDPTIEAMLVKGRVWLKHKTEKISSDVSLNRKDRAIFFKHPKRTVLTNNQPRLVISPNVDFKSLISWKNDVVVYCKDDLFENIINKRMGNLVILGEYFLNDNRYPDEFSYRIIDSLSS